MPNWNIAFRVDATGFCSVEADSEEEAIELAREQFQPSFKNTELGDTLEVVSVEDLG